MTLYQRFFHFKFHAIFDQRMKNLTTFQEELETNKILMTEQFLTENDVILSVSNTINDFILSLANDNKYVVKLKPFAIPMYVHM